MDETKVTSNKHRLSYKKASESRFEFPENSNCLTNNLTVTMKIENNRYLKTQIIKI